MADQSTVAGWIAEAAALVGTAFGGLEYVRRRTETVNRNIEKAREEASDALADHIRRTDETLKNATFAMNQRVDRLEGDMARRSDVQALAAQVSGLTSRIDRVLELAAERHG